MQLDDQGTPQSSQSPTSSPPLKLVSFAVTDVNSVQNLKNTVNLKGVLSLGISRNISVAFQSGIDSMNTGSSNMLIFFKGIYMETKENGGEGLLCLLGDLSSILSTDRCECEEFLESASSNGNPYNDRPQQHFLEDDQILLVLRYPKTFKLTKRTIHGEMVSLDKQGSSRYFSKVHISSQLNSHKKYQFSSELFESRKFGLPPYQDELMEDGAMMFTGEEFCAILDRISKEALNIIPNYRFNGSIMSQTHGQLGPLLLEALNVYDNIKLVFNHVKCEQDTTSIQTGRGNAKVSALLRAFPKERVHDFEEPQTSLSSLTLTAEGIWNSSSGQLLIVGCGGRVESECDYEIAMYFPRAVSIKQRSFLFGSISSLKKDIGLDNPLFFDAMRSSNDFRNNLSYSYSKIELVNRFERPTPPHQILTFIKQSLFQYPALKDGEVPLAQISALASSLGLNGYVASDQLIYGQKSRVLFQIEVLSLGPLWIKPEFVYRRNEPVVIITKEDLKTSQFLNVSMHLVFKIETTYQQTTYKNVSELSLEGLYDPTLAEMHLIGCRKALVEGIGLERGQDCLIEVKIQYLAINFLWRKNQSSAQITISSHRQEDDPLYFSSISLDAFWTYYPGSFGILANLEV